MKITNLQLLIVRLAMINSTSAFIGPYVLSDGHKAKLRELVDSLYAGVAWKVRSLAESEDVHRARVTIMEDNYSKIVHYL